MCDMYRPPQAHFARLEDFEVLRKSAPYTKLYSNSTPTYDLYPEPLDDAAVSALVNSRENYRDDWQCKYGNNWNKEDSVSSNSTLTYDFHAELVIDETSVYTNLTNILESHKDDWKCKYVNEWNEEDTVFWIYDLIIDVGFTVYDVPFYNFQIVGLELRRLKWEDILYRLRHPNITEMLSKNIAYIILDRLQKRLNEEVRKLSVFQYAERVQNYKDNHVSMVDLDSLDHKNRLYTSDYKPYYSCLLQTTYDSSDSTEYTFQSLDTASPKYSCASDNSKLRDKEVKKKIIKKRPGRPKGSGRKYFKPQSRPSIVQFLLSMLLEPKYCPHLIKWENYSEAKFIFIQPEVVAKIWGLLRKNPDMTFEKFSRAMRYHYKPKRLLPVSDKRLVYQFGPNGPNIFTEDPNFIKTKSKY